jgi:2-iminobutanoate/2-iminopropanoate deaminase
MKKSVIATSAGPAAIGPYSQAVRAGGLLFVSGQIALDPSTGKLIDDLSIASQAERVLENLKGIVSAAGASFDDILKVTIYLTDLTDFGQVNGVYARYFPNAAPARATVGVAALPLGVSVEMDCIALADGSGH